MRGVEDRGRGCLVELRFAEVANVACGLWIARKMARSTMARKLDLQQKFE